MFLIMFLRSLSLFLFLSCCCLCCCFSSSPLVNVSLIGEPGMTTDHLRVLFEFWNMCNSAAMTYDTHSNPFPSFPSDSTLSSWYNYTLAPRFADCTDVSTFPPTQLIPDSYNRVSIPYPSHPSPPITPSTYAAFNNYTIEKGLLLGEVCEQLSGDGFSVWTLMVKTGNFNSSYGLCRNTNGGSSSSSGVTSRENTDTIPPLTFNNLPMNGPIVVRIPTQHSAASPVPVMAGSFLGTFELTQAGVDHVSSCIKSFPALCSTATVVQTNISFFQTIYHKDISSTRTTSWKYSHILHTTPQYTWLMLYQRADNRDGTGNGGYIWPAPGMLSRPLADPHWFYHITISINYTSKPGSFSAFYIPEMGGCWGRDGTPCTGSIHHDITHYMNLELFNPPGGCTASSQSQCPLWHKFLNGSIVYRNDTQHFPYTCYGGYCAPGSCDPFSNPVPQELLFLRACSEWVPHGVPEHTLSVGVSYTLTMDLGALIARLYTDVDAGVTDVVKYVMSTEIGPEMNDNNATMIWEVSDWDIWVPTQINGEEQKERVWVVGE